MSIIKVENKTDSELLEIGRRIGESFAAEKSGVVTIIPRDHIVKTFQIMTEFYYKLGVLYQISSNGEGYLAFWHKSQKIPLKLKARVIRRMVSEVPLRSCLLIAPTGREQFRLTVKYEEDYIAVSMVVVLNEFKGKGFMHHLLEIPFSIANSNNIPCVLDTDTELKVKKYMKCGMKISKHTKLRNGFDLYTMEYRAKNHDHLSQ